ncbi:MULTISPECIES: major capsid protein [unclassified Xanthomonas]|uniref:major capsid protein n=1 Tax=unclassified Xanthomonas TaxID=2643310 RepID=UPI002A7FB8FD|nr:MULTISPECIES: hypothetical protein [unclassified Xanthomonas]MDY4297521.1 hypothetical protein [Xanthomonas sp. LF02-5]MDY4359315.1 hypothetical protein [Xanthomonas sp. LF04-12]
MATIGGDAVTLLDVAKRLDPDGNTADIAELLTQNNEILQDIPWYEGNLPTGHRVTQRSGLPAAYYRKMNAGIPKSKSTTVQIDEAFGELTALCEIDKSVADLNGNTAAFRLSEARAFIEAMNQTFCQKLFYGNIAANGEEILGLAPRFSSITGADNGVNIIDAGGTGSNNTSLWLIGWSDHTVWGGFPKGSKAGIQFNKGAGDDWAFDANGNRFRAYIDDYKWQNGLVMKDWRFVVRVANIDTTALTKNASAGADLVDLVAQAVEKIHSLTGVTPRFYGNRTLSSFFRRQISNKIAQSTLAWGDVSGRRVMMLDEVPFRRVDGLLNTEARVV